MFIAALSSACGGHLALPNPDVAGTSAHGTHVRYVLPNGENLRLPIRDPQVAQVTEQEPCPASLYLELGSRTFIKASVAEKQRELHDAGRGALAGAEAERFRAEREEQLNDRRAEMGYNGAEAFLAAVPDDRRDGHGVPRARTIDCNLTLHETDRIFTRLQFTGPTSSNTRVDCRCADDESGQCAQIVSPYSLSEMRTMHGEGIHGGEPPMMSFLPTNCGLSRIDESGRYIDAQGAIAPRCDPVTNVAVTDCEIHGRIWAR